MSMTRRTMRGFKHNMSLQLVASCHSNPKDKDWEEICTNYILSEAFIKRFQKYIDWNLISKHQHLSEQFIEKFKDKVNWDYISQYQVLSKDFINNFYTYVNWYNIRTFQNHKEWPPALSASF